MTSSRPYIMRALYEWILDNECTPYVLVNTEKVGVEIPPQYVKDGQIILNISPTAVMNLDIGNDAMHFNGRFGGVPVDIYVPMPGVLAIYARENGQGMVFEGDDGPGPSGKQPALKQPTPKQPTLKVVK